ncbi:hypothetical protein [Paraburkholderia atlantica]|uniref:hypothetical protein n=1 Tax=Paraburkholderia atlantica TaxID=2654982 RepID=UPI00161F1F81|nr:hypothetical protein [Paraburkholderia atlantica]MBB5508101.1 hypothetical protein [Paraburkholderia atlantica]
MCWPRQYGRSFFETDMKETKTEAGASAREGFEEQRRAGINVDWFTWQIAWHDAMFKLKDCAATRQADAAPSDEMERAYQRRHAMIVTDREDFEAGYRAAIAAGGAQEPTNLARYQWLRRRAVMVDYSDDTVTKLTLLKDEGPTGEFLDDWIDGEIAASGDQS